MKQHRVSRRQFVRETAVTAAGVLNDVLALARETGFPVN